MSQHARPGLSVRLASLLVTVALAACSNTDTAGGGSADSGGGGPINPDLPAGSDGGTPDPDDPDAAVGVDTATGGGVDIDAPAVDTASGDDSGQTGGGSDTATPPGADAEDAGTVEADAESPGDTASGSETGGGLVTCGQEEIALEVGLIPPTILVLLDRSGSMYDRWGTTVTSVRNMIAATAGQVTMGLMMFPSERSCSTTLNPQVPIGPDGAGRIVAAMEASGTGGSTPMGPATEAAKDYLLSYPARGEVAMVLVADGKPTDTCMQKCTTCNCDDLDGCTLCGGSGAANCNTFTTQATCPRNGCVWEGGACYSYGAELIACAHREVEIPIRELAVNGIRTWIVGFAGGFGESNLLRTLATAGGTVNETPNGFFDAGEGAALGTILASIQSQMSACRAHVNIPPGYAFPSVKIDGVAVPRDPSHANGWDWVADGELSLFGAACDQAQAEGARVEITFLCKG